ncbi:MAG: hypothetical protein ACFFB5_21860 [Promethearchaeota archaeon]
MAIEIIKIKLTSKRRIIGTGLVLYFSSLFTTLVILTLVVTGWNNIFSSSILSYLPFNLMFIIILVILALPAIPSSYFSSYWGKDQSDGIFVVVVAGLIIILLFFLWWGLNLLVYPQFWEGYYRMVAFLSVPIFLLFFFFPIGLFSTFFAALFGWLGSKGLRPKD